MSPMRHHRRMGDMLKLLKADHGAGTAYERCLCHRLVALTGCVRRHSGVINYLEILCKDCQSDVRDYARIVCLGCRRLTSFLPPQRHRCGFVFGRGRHYHIRECCFCSPKVVAVDSSVPVLACPVIELERYAREQSYRVEPDPDIIRHAEQFRLPADDHFATVVRRQFRQPTK